MATRKSARIASRGPTANRDSSTHRQHDVLTATDSAGEVAVAAADRGSEPNTSTDTAETDTDTRPAKRRRTQPKPKPKPNPKPTNKPTTSGTNTTTTLTHPNQPSPPTPLPLPLPTAPFPSRTHPPTYHTPLLLTTPPSRTALLTWYTTASQQRPMPWRKPFRPPHSLPPATLAQRAYEVWISEIMLQQTRVQTVVGYWTRWMERWPAIQDLAAASEEDVLSVWAGLGYYSRAGRVWRAARGVVAESGGLLPGSVEGLMGVEGIGRYTAGAVAAIAFGVPAAMVDGNVLRVLSRQMGVLGDVKGDRRVVALLWEAAERLVEVVAADREEEVNERPGLWGQALMELGSTVCTPKPNCAVCPITATCRAYAEGRALAEKRGRPGCELADMEDICTLCAPFEEALEDGEEARVDQFKNEPSSKEGRLSRFFASPHATKPTATTTAEAPDARALQTITNHAKRFPLKKSKKKVREEEALVCAIRRSSDGRCLIHRRPEKGLLGGMWELPSHTLQDSSNSTAKGRKAKALSYVAELVGAGNAKGATVCSDLKHVGDLGSVPWLFSHLKLTMHVYVFELDDAVGSPELSGQARWAATEEIDRESMGTGMKKCWSLVKEMFE